MSCCLPRLRARKTSGKTVNGKAYGTNAEAALARGLVASSLWQPFVDVLREAREHGGATVDELRQLFAVLAWEVGHAALVLPLVSAWLVNDDEGDAALLADLHRRFHAMRRESAAVLGQPPSASCLLAEDRSSAALAEFGRLWKTLVTEQRAVVVRVMRAVLRKAPLALCLTGPARGVGGFLPGPHGCCCGRHRRGGKESRRRPNCARLLWAGCCRGFACGGRSIPRGWTQHRRAHSACATRR